MFGERDHRGCVPFSTTRSIDLMFNRSGKATKAMWLSDKSTWGNALVEPLPRSSNLKIFCLYDSLSLSLSHRKYTHFISLSFSLVNTHALSLRYGVGVDTERAYLYKYDKGQDSLEMEEILYAEGDGTVVCLYLNRSAETRVLAPARSFHFIQDS